MTANQPTEPTYVISPNYSTPAAFATFEEAERYAWENRGEVVPASQVNPTLRYHHEQRLGFRK